jgi:hypothetical protein
MAMTVTDSMSTSERIFYRLRHRNGRLVTLTVTSNNGTDFCGENTVELSLCGEKPAIFDDISAVRRTLSTNAPWYNSDETWPSWGSLDPADLTVEMVHEIVEHYVSTVDPRDVRLPKVDGMFIADIRGELRFAKEPITVGKRHRLLYADRNRVLDHALVGQDFVFGSRRLRGVAVAHAHGRECLLVEAIDE